MACLAGCQAHPVLRQRLNFVTAPIPPNSHAGKCRYPEPPRPTTPVRPDSALSLSKVPAQAETQRGGAGFPFPLDGGRPGWECPHPATIPLLRRDAPRYPRPMPAPGSPRLDCPGPASSTEVIKVPQKSLNLPQFPLGATQKWPKMEISNRICRGRFYRGFVSRKKIFRIETKTTRSWIAPPTPRPAPRRSCAAPASSPVSA